MPFSPEEQASLEGRVLNLVNAPNYQPIKPKVIAKKLGLDKDQTKDLRKLIKKLVKRGQLSFGHTHLIRPPGAAESDRVTGVFRRTQGGFGFVRPRGAENGRDDDIFVALEDSRDAASGDVVLIKLLKRKGRQGKPEGLIVEVIERETHEFVGTYLESAGQGFVRVDGGMFNQPIAVGDPGAKNARADDKVVFEMVRFPSHSHDGEGVIVEVLGARGAPGVDTLSVIREYKLPGEFAEDALEEARVEADRFEEAVPEGRLDLTGETTITIDPIDARDFDDAISLRRLENGHWRLSVHIADVSYFVRPGTALNREAYERGTSAYLPDKVIPMLPEIISNALASLQPDRIRLTKTARIEFTGDGARVVCEVHNTCIRSDRRFTYEEVDEYLADREGWRTKLSPEVHHLLGLMHELAMTLRRRRMKRGALELSMPEVKVDLDSDGHVCGAHEAPSTESHQIIEEFMLAANEAVAEMLRDAEWQFLRRLHFAPTPRKLKALTSFVKELGFEVESLESRFALQALLNDVIGKPEQEAVHYAVLRSLPRAVYGPTEDGHFALATDCYCHFTSPIRRYPDLTIHRMLDAHLSGQPPRNDFGALAALGEHCSERERRAEAAERELTKVKLLLYLTDHIGMELDAVITGVESFGVFARGLELPAEGLIHVNSLQDDFYDFERVSHALCGRRSGNRFRLGDRIRVQVARIDMENRELDFRLLAKKAAPRGAKASAPKGARKKQARKTTTRTKPKSKPRKRR